MSGAKWLLGGSVLALCAGVAAACGSSPSGGGEGGDSGTDSASSQDAASSPDAASSDATQEAAQDTATDRAGDAGAGDACLVVDVSIATVDAGRVWGCFQSACAAPLGACAGDCSCNDALLLALLCVADGGTTSACFNTEITQNASDRNVVLVYDCLLTNELMCLGSGTGADGGAGAESDGQTEAEAADVGAEAGGDGPAEAASEGGADAGTIPDGGAEAGTEAGTEGGSDAAPEDAAASG